MNKKEKVKDVKVLSPKGREISPTTKKKAIKMVARDKAIWVKRGKVIQIKYYKMDFAKWREEVITKANRVCYICNYQVPENEIISIDHFIPKQKLGKDSIDNLQCCCKRCNDEKGNLLLTDYIEKMKLDKKKYYYINFEELEKTNERLMEGMNCEDIKLRAIM